MARDEALLQACRNADSPLTLRFYSWSPPTISLGYFQDYSDYQYLPPPAGALPAVRRTTGGGAILHDLELTYSVVIPKSHPLIAGRPNDLYGLAHQAVIRAIGHGIHLLGGGCASCGASGQRGPFFCFARRHALDVVIADGYGPGGFSKIAGSAQRRTATAILQHGSIILNSRYPQQPVATWTALSGNTIGFDEAARRLLPAFAEALDADFRPDAWTDRELISAAEFEPLYAGLDWTARRKR